jgi:hypothetical protein
MRLLTGRKLCTNPPYDRTKTDHEYTHEAKRDDGGRDKASGVAQLMSNSAGCLGGRPFCHQTKHYGRLPVMFEDIVCTDIDGVRIATMGSGRDESAVQESDGKALQPRGINSDGNLIGPVINLKSAARRRETTSESSNRIKNVVRCLAHPMSILFRLTVVRSPRADWVRALRTQGPFPDGPSGSRSLGIGLSSLDFSQVEHDGATASRGSYTPTRSSISWRTSMSLRASSSGTAPNTPKLQSMRRQ